MLAFPYRFHGHGSLRYVYKNGRAVRSRLLTVKYTHNKHRKSSRFAVVVSKKVHKSAVGRNRIRRRIYEIIRRELPRFSQPSDIAVIITSNEVLDLPADELYSAVTGAFEKSGLYN